MAAVFLVGLLPVISNRPRRSQRIAETDARSTTARPRRAAGAARADRRRSGARGDARARRRAAAPELPQPAAGRHRRRRQRRHHHAPDAAAGEVPDRRGDHGVLRRARAARGSAAQRRARGPRVAVSAAGRSSARACSSTVRRRRAGTTLPTAYATVASRGYFEALGMRLRAGRTFDDRDRAGAPRVVVVNEAFVSRYLGGTRAARRAHPHRRQTGPVGAGGTDRRRRQYGQCRRRVAHRRPRCSCRWSRDGT